MKQLLFAATIVITLLAGRVMAGEAIGGAMGIEGAPAGLLAAQERWATEGFPEELRTLPGMSLSLPLPSPKDWPAPANWPADQDWDEVADDAWIVPAIRAGFILAIVILNNSKDHGFCWNDGPSSEGKVHDGQRCVCNSYPDWMKSCGWIDLDPLPTTSP